jgi:LPXTG-motif cell wall-anchored protein
MKKSHLLLAAPVFATAMFISAPVFAAGYDGNGVTVSETEAVPGTEVTFTATGFKPNSAVTITLTKDGVSAQSLSAQSVSAASASLTINAIADAAGSVNVKVTVPASLAAGNYTLAADGIDPSGAPRMVSAPITVADEMPNTGSSSSPMQVIALAAAATAAGAALLKRRAS